MLFKTFTAGLLATTLSFTSIAPTTASAELSREDAVVGVATLLLLGAAIHNSRDDDDDHSSRRSGGNGHRGDGWRVLPSECLTRVTRRNGDRVRIFGQRCLNNNYRAVHRLPQECHVSLRTRDGHRRQGFGARCLQNQGFRTTRH